VYRSNEAGMQLVGFRADVRGQCGGRSAKPVGGHRRVVLSKVFGQQ